MKKLFAAAIIITMISCKTTKLNSSGEAKQTWNTRHLDIVHKTPWKAGKNNIIPVGFAPVKSTAKK